MLSNAVTNYNKWSSGSYHIGNYNIYSPKRALSGSDVAHYKMLINEFAGDTIKHTSSRKSPDM